MAAFKRQKQQAFTLIEMLIVIVIVGILAAIAYPSYQASAQKSRRADGKAAVVDAAALQEKFYFRENEYTSSVDDLNGATSTDGYYSVSIEQPCGSSSCFTMVATATGIQASDTDCAEFSMTHTGVRAAADSDGNDTTADCW